MRRILQISDVHFGPPLRPSTLAGVLDVIDRRRPDLVVLAGDLTQRAKPWQFEQARDLVDTLEVSVPVFVVPGNHDVPLYRVWERIFDPYGAYRRGFSDELEPCYRDDELFVVGLNSAYGWTTSHGRLTRRTLALTRKRLDSVREESGLCRIAVAHHPIVRPPSFHGQRLARRAKRAAEVFVEGGVEIVLSGHVHHFYSGTLRDTYPDLAGDALVLHSGTATSNRGRPPENGCNTCNFLEIDTAEIRFERLGWQRSSRSFESEASFSVPRLRRETLVEPAGATEEALASATAGV